MAGWRVDLPVAHRRVLVVGGGPNSLPQIAAARAAGADVMVAAAGRDLADSVVDLIDRGLVRQVSDPVADADLAAADLIVAATDDPDQDAALAARATAMHRFCLVWDRIEPDPGEGPSGTGTVTLVGGGPGDPGLITVAGLEAVRRADVLVCDRLAPLAVLEQAKPGAEIVDVAKIPRGRTTPQEEINQILIERALAGHTVVRLKGGDSFVFGRGGEEWQACLAEDIPVTVIPGVTSAIAAPAAAGIPATHRTLTQGFTVVSGHLAPGAEGSTLDWAALARSGTSIIVMMGMANLAAIATALLAAGMSPDTPAATVADGGLPSQKVVRDRLDRIAAATVEAGLRAPAVTVIGSVAAFEPAAHGQGGSSGPEYGSPPSTS
jgi:uroporphyrin-III C-methyltransferase